MLLRRLVGADLTRRALRRGVLGGNPMWRTLAFVLVIGRVMRRGLARPPRIVATERLTEGSSLSIVSRRRGRR